MCDYSLHNVQSRPARAGDRLVTTSFTNSITRGFADAIEPEVAVILLPGTEVAFQREAEYQGGWTIFPKRKVAGNVARFRLVDVDNPNVHHHALEFADGEVVLVTRLREGQPLRVVQLPVIPHNENKVTGPELDAVLG